MRFLLVLLALPVLAANHYILASASGAGTGTDWTNACTDFTGSCAAASLARGDTYYVGTGAYAARTFAVTASGTSVITIKGATVADHGTSTGWSNAFSVASADGGSQAVFTAPILFQTSYWVFNGSVGGQVASATPYGFRIKVGNCSSPASNYSLGLNGNPSTNFTIAHIAVVQCGASFGGAQSAFAFGAAAQEISNTTVQYVYAVNANGCFDMTNFHDSTVEYWICDAGWGSSAEHGDVIDESASSAAQTQNDTWRYGLVINMTPTSQTGVFVALGGAYVCPINGWKIYGNVFWNTAGGNGTIGAGGDTIVICNSLIYNNTIVDNGPAFFRQCDTGAASCSSATGNVVENNLFCNSNPEISAFTGGAITEDYNSYSNSTGTPNSEPHGQVASFGCANLFTNYAGGVFTPLQAAGSGTNQINAGLALGSPYDVDPDGLTRNASDWMRGAFEFASASPPAIMNPPLGNLWEVALPGPHVTAVVR